MRDHITPVMHRQFLSMIERNTASAEIRNMTPEHPNPESLIPSNLADSLSELAPSPPSHTNGLSPSVTKETHWSLPNPDPQTPPCLGCQQTPSPALSRLQASLRHQQWLCCTPEQANNWKPSRVEVENLDKKLKIKKHVRFPSPNDADTNGEEGLDIEQKNCQQNKQQPPQTPSPHPPNGSSPTQPIPHHSNLNNPTTPFPQNLDHKLLTIQTQRRAEKETPRAGPQSSTRHASENEMRKDDDDDNDDVETILGDGEEEDMGGVLYRCEERAGAVNESQGIEVVMDWRWSWKRLHTIEPILCL